MKDREKIFETINPLVYGDDLCYISILGIARCAGNIVKDIFMDKIRKYSHLI